VHNFTPFMQRRRVLALGKMQLWQQKKDQERKQWDARRDEKNQIRMILGTFLHLLHRSRIRKSLNQVTFLAIPCLIVATFTASASSPEEKRQISQSSTLSKSIDSVGGGLVLCTNEINTSHMVNAFMTGLMGMWRRSAILEFIPPHVRQLSLEIQYADP